MALSGKITIEQITLENFARVKQDLNWILDQPATDPKTNNVYILVRPLNRGEIIKYELVEKVETPPALIRTLGVRVYQRQGEEIRLTMSDKYQF